MVATSSRFQVEAAEQRERKLMQATLFENDLRFQLGSEAGRRNYWRLLEATGALADSIAHSTATTQSGNVALRDFGIRHLFKPALDLCPDLFLKMKAENGGSNGSAG